MGAMTLAILATSPLSDLEFLESSLRTTFAEIPWKDFPDTLVLTREGPENRWAWVVEEVLREMALSGGRGVATMGGGPTLAYRVGNLQLGYEKKKGFLPWSQTRIARTIRVQVYLTITDENHVVVWNRAFSSVQSDEIPAGYLDAVRVEGLSPGMPPEHEGTGITGPVLTAVLLGGLLYLFYTFESQ